MPGKKFPSSEEWDFVVSNKFDSDTGVKQQGQQSKLTQPQQQYRRKFSQINHEPEVIKVFARFGQQTLSEPEARQIINKQIPSVLHEEDLQVKILDLKGIFATKLAPERPKYFKEIVEKNKHAMIQKSMLSTLSRPIFTRKHAPKMRAYTKIPKGHPEPKRDKRKQLEANSVYECNEFRRVGPNRELIVITGKTSKTVNNLSEPLQQHPTRTADNSLTIIKSKKDRARRRKSKSERKMVMELASTSKINDKSVHHTKPKRIKLKKVKLNRQKTMPMTLLKAITNFIDNMQDG